MADDLDTLAPNFRRATDRWPEAPTLANHYKALLDCYDGNGHALVETVKSFIECVCLTILGEFGKPMPSSNPSMTEMLVESLKLLGLNNTRGASKLDSILSAHNRLADALADMRNETGPVAHGKDGFLDALTHNHLRAYLLTGDTILGLLLCALEGTEPDLLHTREPYERFGHLNERIDRSVMLDSSIEDEEESPVLVLTLRTAGLRDGVELRVEPSRLLYALDRTAYVELLESAAIKAAEEEPSEGREMSTDTLAARSPPPQEIPPATEVVPAYHGRLEPLREALKGYIDSLGLGMPANAPGASLMDSLLATADSNMGIDWTDRDAPRARMKVGLRRTLRYFGVEDKPATECAEHLVTWFRVNAAGLSNT